MGEEQPQGATGKLEQLARARFGETLTPCELKLMRAAPNRDTAVCGPNDNDEDHGNDPSKADKEWGREREIRAEVIRWLCVDQKAKHEVDPRGIWVYGAKITGKLDLSSVNVSFPVSLHHCRLVEDAEFYDAQLPILDLQGSWVRAVSADGIKVHGAAFLNDGFRAEGEVRLVSAQIGGDLDCTNGKFINPSGVALSAGGIKVQGSVFLNNDLRAEGEVSLLGVQIGGSLVCADSTFTKLDAHAANVKGDFWWQGLKDAGHATLDLRNASVGSILDDEKSWPAQGSILVDGFVYGRITEGPTDAKTRLGWLARQDPFAPQPYRQLAKVLTERGDEDGAVAVLEEMERLRRKQEDHTAVARLESWIFKESIGYGYNPARAVWGIVGLSALA